MEPETLLAIAQTADSVRRPYEAKIAEYERIIAALSEDCTRRIAETMAEYGEGEDADYFIPEAKEKLVQIIDAARKGARHDTAE